MEKQHRVRFEPIGLEIEVSEDETVLDGAFRQGFALAHGCKVGQCSACKSYLLDGEVDLEKYSTFALADYEVEEGYTLLCRAHAYSDLEVELLHWDDEMTRAGAIVREYPATIEAIEPLTHDIRHLRLKLPTSGGDMSFTPGQYVDLSLPGADWSRSYSMANTRSARDGSLEFMIRVYPDGRFSSLLEGLQPGDELQVKGPYGVFILREHSDSDIVFIGGGAGLAPIWGLLQSMVEKGIDRKATFYFGARGQRDLFHLAELERLAEQLPSFRFVPVLSDAADDVDWQGERGMVTEVVERLEGDLSQTEAYLCGPPPMIDAAMVVLEAKGVPEDRIFFDKFTSTASMEEATSGQPPGR